MSSLARLDHNTLSSCSVSMSRISLVAVNRTGLNILGITCGFATPDF